MAHIETSIFVERETVIEGEETTEELEIKISGNVVAGTPGRTWGRPENCYESDPGYTEILTATHNGASFELTSTEEKAAKEALEEEAGSRSNDRFCGDDEY